MYYRHFLYHPFISNIKKGKRMSNLIPKKGSFAKFPETILVRFRLVHSSRAVCTACALAIGLLLRHGAHVLHARHPRALALLLLLLIVILVGATAAPAALLMRDVIAEARLAVLDRTLLKRERLLAAAPSFALVTASTTQLGMIASFLRYRRGLLLEDIAAAEHAAAHRRKQLLPSNSHTAAAAAASSLMV